MAASATLELLGVARRLRRSPSATAAVPLPVQVVAVVPEMGQVTDVAVVTPATVVLMTTKLQER